MFSGDKEIKAGRSSFAIDNSGNSNALNIDVRGQTKLTSLLNPLLERIVEAYDFDEELEQVELPGVEEKILYNSVKVHAEEIRDSTGYMSLIEELIDHIDDESPNAKKKFLAAIFKNYKKHKKALLIENATDPNDKEAVQILIRANADKLIQSVAQTMLAHAEGEIDAPVELVQTAQELIVGFGFINCRILERPV